MLFCCLQEIHTLLLSKLPWEKDGWYWTKVKMGCVFLKHLDDSELSIYFIVEAQKKKQKEYPQKPMKHIFQIKIEAKEV